MVPNRTRPYADRVRNVSGSAIRSAHPPAALLYQRRRPEKTTLYQVVEEHVETFFAQVERETKAGLPEFVKDEFDAFLRCGILAHGFLRLRCSACTKDTLVAFSCKRRGFCPACGARRMAETAAYLLDHVIPHVPVRQWVLSFPIPLRHLFATQPHLLSPILQVITRALSTFLIYAFGGRCCLLRFMTAANKLTRLIGCDDRHWQDRQKRKRPERIVPIKQLQTALASDPRLENTHQFEGHSALAAFYLLPVPNGR